MTIIKEKKREKIEYPSGNFAANPPPLLQLLLSLSSSQKISPKEYVPYEN